MMAARVMTEQELKPEMWGWDLVVTKGLTSPREEWSGQDLTSYGMKLY